MNGSYRRSPQRVFWGPGALEHVRHELDRARASRPLVVCGASVQAHPRLLSRVIDALEGSIAGVFGTVRSHAPVASVEAAAAALDELSADSVIAVGGGSALVTARAACILHGEHRSIDELATRRLSAAGEVVSPRLARPKLPIIAVPTTPTTAVCKAGTAVTSPGTPRTTGHVRSRRLGRGPILLEPEFLDSSPPRLVRDAPSTPS